MALVDDLVQFVSDNTLDGSWYKPQLKQRCEEFLEDGGIVAPTGTISITENGTVDVTQYASAEVEVNEMPDKVTVAMMESVEWPELVEIATEGGGYFTGENVDEVLVINESHEAADCSFIVAYLNKRYVFSYTTQGAIVFSCFSDDGSAEKITIAYNDAIVIESVGATDNYVYDAESNTYIYDGGSLST